MFGSPLLIAPKAPSQIWAAQNLLSDDIKLASYGGSFSDLVTPAPVASVFVTIPGTYTITVACVYRTHAAITANHSLSFEISGATTIAAGTYSQTWVRYSDGSNTGTAGGSWVDQENFGFLQQSVVLSAGWNYVSPRFRSPVSGTGFGFPLVWVAAGTPSPTYSVNQPASVTVGPSNPTYWNDGSPSVVGIPAGTYIVQYAQSLTRGSGVHYSNFEPLVSGGTSINRAPPWNVFSGPQSVSSPGTTQQGVALWTFAAGTDIVLQQRNSSAVQSTIFDRRLIITKLT